MYPGPQGKKKLIGVECRLLHSMYMYSSVTCSRPPILACLAKRKRDHPVFIFGYYAIFVFRPGLNKTLCL